jgi:hypothetical protein
MGEYGIQTGNASQERLMLTRNHDSVKLTMMMMPMMMKL